MTEHKVKIASFTPIVLDAEASYRLENHGPSEVWIGSRDWTTEPARCMPCGTQVHHSVIINRAAEVVIYAPHGPAEFTIERT